MEKKQMNLEEIDNQISRQKKWNVILLSTIIAISIIGGILICLESIALKSVM